MAGDRVERMRQVRASAGYFKGHGLGNDYLVFEAGKAWVLTPGSIARVCDRWRGVGSDGIVVRLPSPPDGPEDRRRDGADARHDPDVERQGSAGAADGSPGKIFRLRMFNPDGSEFERSGNGLRILAAYLASRGEVGNEPFTVEIGGSRLALRVLGRGPGGIYDVSVGMGTAGLEDEDVAVDRARLNADTDLPLPPVSFRTVSVGNPHCVIFTDDLSDEALFAVGPRVATHPAFSHGTNVQLAKRVGDRRIRIAIWERGVGQTAASGTSSCAAAVAAVREGRVPPGEVQVEMAGGELLVTVTRSLDVTLRGPVQEVGTGTLAETFVEGLEGL